MVRRIIRPIYQFIIMNKKNKNNAIEDITENFQIQISDPYLLYRNSKGEINGMWFYGENEREKISNILLKLKYKLNFSLLN